MKVRDHRQMMRSLTDPLNIPKLRALIETHPVLTQEEFRTRQNMAKGGTPQLVQPGPGRPGYSGEEDMYNIYKEKVGPGKYRYKIKIKNKFYGQTIGEEGLPNLKKTRDKTLAKIYPNRITDEKFITLKNTKKYKNMSGPEFAAVLNEKGYTTLTGQEWNQKSVNRKADDLDIKLPGFKRSEKEVLEIIKKVYGGPAKIQLYKQGAISLESLRDIANDYEKRQKPDFLKKKMVADEKALVAKAKKTGSFPPGSSAKNNLFFQLYRAAVEHKDGRWSLKSDLPPLYKGKRDWTKNERWKNAKFYDNELNRTITYDNLKNYVNEVGGEGAFDNWVKTWDNKKTLNNTKIFFKGQEVSLGKILSDKNLAKEFKKVHGRSPKPGELAKFYKDRYPLGKSSFAINHPDGVKNNWWKGEVVLKSANDELNKLDRSFKSYLDKAPDDFARQKIIKRYAKEVADIGNITGTLEGQTFGKTPKPMKIVEKAFTEAGLTRTFDAQKNAIFKAYQANGIGKGCPIGKAEGGRIGFAKAGIVDDKCMRNAINEHKRKLGDGNEAAIKKQMKINQTKGLKNMFTMGRRGLQSIISGVGLNHPGALALEAAIEAGFYGYGRQQGESHEQARENLFFPKILAKYAPDLWEKFGGKPFKTGVWEGPEKLIEEELLAENESAQEYAQGMKALEDEYANASKIDFELGILNNQWRPGSEEQIEAKKQELKDSYDRIEELQINIKEGTPIHDAYVAAQEKQKALQDKRAQDYYGDSPAYKGSKQRQWQKEFLDYRGADRKYRKEQPFAFKGGIEDAIVKPGTRIDWDAYADYGWDKPEQKWKDLYDMGGWDLMDRIGIAGGVSKMSKGGRASYLDGGIVSLLKK